LIEKPATTNMAAYELYLRGREYASLYNNMTYNYQQQYLSEAIRLYNEAIQIDPQFALAYVGLGELCIARYQWDLFTTKENYADSVNRIIEHVLHLNDNLSEAYVLKGLYNFFKGEYSSTLSNLNRAITLNPNASLAYMYRGYCYAFLSNDKVNEIISFTKAEKLEKSGTYLPQILCGNGICYLFLGDTLKSDYYIRKSLGIRPQNPQALQLLSEKLFFLDKNYEEAFALQDTLLNLTLDTLVYSSGKLWYCLYKKDFNAALNWFEKERIAAKWKADIQFLLSVSRMGHKLQPLDNCRYACVLMNLGKKQEAIKLLDGAILNLNSKPSDQTLNYDLSTIYALKGDKEKAILHLQKFIESGFLGFAMTYLDIYVNPMFDNIRQTDEFKALLKEGEAQIKKKRDEVRRLEEEGLL
jgi:adenylate cyclase